MLKMLAIKGPIKTESQYEDALEQAHALMQLTYVKDSPEADQLDLLVMLIEEHEAKHYPIEYMPQNPIDAIKERLEEMKIEEADLMKIFGNRHALADILSGKRKLNLAMIRRLHEKLKIPAETLIAVY